MRKQFITTLLLVLTALATFAAEPARYKLNVQDFCELQVVDDVCVEYCCCADSAGWAIFTCLPEMASHIMFSNTNDHLTIRTDFDEKSPVGVPAIKVYSAVLRKAVNSGDSLLVLHLDPEMSLKDFKAHQIGNGHTQVCCLNCEALDAGVTAGNGFVEVSGKARKAKLNNAGSGKVSAKNLETANMNCYVFGTGNIECKPSENLRVYGAGTGKVIYHGEPKITMRALGVKAIPYTPDMAITAYRNR